MISRRAEPRLVEVPAEHDRAIVVSSGRHLTHCRQLTGQYG